MFAHKWCLKQEESKASNKKQGYLHSSSREINRSALKVAALELGAVPQHRASVPGSLTDCSPAFAGTRQ